MHVIQSPSVVAERSIPRWPGIVVAAVCAAVYLAVGSGGTFRFAPSPYNHHLFTAHAWLQGRLYLTKDELLRRFLLDELSRMGQTPSSDLSIADAVNQVREGRTAEMRRRGLSSDQIDYELVQIMSRPYHDWVHLDGRYYAYWPPMPAVLALPFVATLGTGASDILITNLLGAATVLLLFFMLRALKPHWPELTTTGCAGLTVLYGLGTVHLYQACIGQVWLMTQITATFFLVAAIWMGILALRDPRWIIPAGVALGLGFLSRSTIMLAAGFFVVILWIASRRAGVRDLRRILLCGAGFAVALLAAIGVQLAFNAARFGDALDFGQGHLAEEGGNPNFAEDFKRYGRFHPHYLATNVYHYFLCFTTRTEVKGVPMRSFEPLGNSLFMISPAMIYIFLAWRQRQRQLLAAVVAGAIPGTLALMLFHGTGWFQFGHRYLLDVMPFLLLLAGFGMRGRLTNGSGLLILMSIAMNAWGTQRFCFEQT